MKKINENIFLKNKINKVCFLLVIPEEKWRATPRNLKGNSCLKFMQHEIENVNK